MLLRHPDKVKPNLALEIVEAEKRLFMEEAKAKRLSGFENETFSSRYYKRRFYISISQYNEDGFKEVFEKLGILAFRPLFKTREQPLEEQVGGEQITNDYIVYELEIDNCTYRVNKGGLVEIKTPLRELAKNMGRYAINSEQIIRIEGDEDKLLWQNPYYNWDLTEKPLTAYEKWEKRNQGF